MACPPATGEDRCGWHASGTAAEDDPSIRLRRWLHRDRPVRPVLGEERIVAKSPEGLRQPGGETRTLARLLKWCLVAAVLAV